MDAADVMSMITTYVVLAVGLVGAMVVGRWTLKALILLGGRYDGGGSSPLGTWQSSDGQDRSFDGYFSSGGWSVGRGDYHPDSTATHKSVDRHLRKNR